MMEDLECPVCYESYDLLSRSPRVLPCSGAHALCEKCAVQLRGSSNVGGNEFACPSCREVIPIGVRINPNRPLLAALKERAEAAGRESRLEEELAKLQEVVRLQELDEPAAHDATLATPKAARHRVREHELQQRARKRKSGHERCKGRHRPLHNVPPSRCGKEEVQLFVVGGLLVSLLLVAAWLRLSGSIALFGDSRPYVVVSMRSLDVQGASVSSFGFGEDGKLAPPTHIPSGAIPHNVHGAYEFVVKAQVAAAMPILIYDEHKSFSIKAPLHGPGIHKIQSLVERDGLVGGKKGFLAAVRFGDNLRIFVDKLVPPPAWDTKTDLRNIKRMRRMAKELGMEQVGGIAGADGDNSAGMWELA
jgi:hypothetical protein